MLAYSEMMVRLTETGIQPPSGQSSIFHGWHAKLIEWSYLTEPQTWDSEGLQSLLGGTPKGTEVLRKDDASGDSDIE